MNFKEWLESVALMTTSTGRGGFDNETPDEDDGGDDGDGWNWERMERYRWQLLSWCRESDAVKKITALVGDVASRQKPTKVEYMVNLSQYPPPRYFIQLRYLFEVPLEDHPIETQIRKILQSSDVHKPLKVDQSQLYRLLENDKVVEYITHIILHYLANQDSEKASPFTAAHFGWKKESILSNHFSFNVWNRLKKNWETSVLPKISEIAVHSRNRVERPKNWMDLGKPEVKAEFSEVRIQHSGTVYGHEENGILASVTVVVPFDWNIIGNFTECMKEQPSVASMFSGIGTVEAGMGARSAYASEHDRETIDHFNLVHGTRHRPKDATKADPRKIRDSGASLFHASPVCKNFSCAKTWRGADEMDRKSSESIANVILKARPPSVSMENVPEYMNTVLFSKITEALDRVGYTWDVNIVNTADYGGFQNRRRMILRAVLGGNLPPLPKKKAPGDWFQAVKDLLPTAESSALGREEKRRINDMILKGALDPLRPIISMGGSAFKNSWSASNSGGPAPTIKASSKEVPRIIMPDGRILRVTPRMMARMASLPDSMPVPENHGLAKQYIGNGVDGTISRLFLAPLARRNHLDI